MAFRFQLPFADVGKGITPFAGAKLSFFDVGTSNPKTTYSDFALTTPNQLVVTADPNGLFPDIFLDAQADVTLTDANDVPIWGPDTIYSPDDTFSAETLLNELPTTDANSNTIALLQNGLKRTAAEIAAGVTPTDYSYPSFDVRRYGAVGDGAADDTAAIQDAINVASFVVAQAEVKLPSGRYSVGDLYTHYDATNNPNFNSAQYSGGHITLQGTGAGDYTPFVLGGTYKGSVLHFTSNSGLFAGDGSQTARGVWLRDLSLIGSSTAQIVKFDFLSRNCGIQNAFVWNDDAGDGVVLSDTFLIQLEDVYIYLNNATKICLQVVNPTQGAGIYTMDRVTCRGGYYGKVFGNHTGATGSAMANISLNGCQETQCVEGLVFGTGVKASTVISHYIEQCTNCSIRIFRGASNITFISPWLAGQNCTEADVVLGLSGGTALEKRHENITFISPQHPQVLANGYLRFSATDAKGLLIISPRMTDTTGSTATAFNIANEDQHGLTIQRPIYTNTFATEITTPARVDLIVEGDTLGQWTFQAPVEFNGNMGFYGTTPIAQQTGVTVDAAGIHAALVNLGLITA